MLDGEASVECSLHFLGEERSIDKMQGDVVVCGADSVERSIHYQILQTPSDDTSRTDLDIDIMEEQESLLRMKYMLNSDAVRFLESNALNVVLPVNLKQHADIGIDQSVICLPPDHFISHRIYYGGAGISAADEIYGEQRCGQGCVRSQFLHVG